MGKMTTLIYNVIGGILTAIILYYFQPILGATYKAIISLANIIGGRVAGLPYLNASRGEVRMLLLSVMILMLGAVILIYYSVLSDVLKPKTKPLTDDNNTTKLGRITNVLNKIASTMPKFMVIFYLLALFFVMTVTAGTINLNTVFNQRLTILSPHISDFEYKTFKASWASMKSKHDFDLIMARMDNVAITNNIVIPKMDIK